MSSKKEPETEAELEKALESIGYEIVDHGPGDFSAGQVKTGRTWALDAEDRASALLEAWNTFKP